VEWKSEQGMEDRSQKPGLNSNIVDCDTESEKRWKRKIKIKMVAKIFNV
jgi:hypothetical protein